jgi:hypothetical protein
VERLREVGFAKYIEPPADVQPAHIDRVLTRIVASRRARGAATG